MSKIINLLIKNKFIICNALLSVGAGIGISYVKRKITSRYITEDSGHKFYASMLQILFTMICTGSIYKYNAAQVIGGQVLLIMKFVRHEVTGEVLNVAEELLKKEAEGRIITLQDQIKRRRLKELDSMLAAFQTDMKINNLIWRNKTSLELQSQGWSGLRLTKQLNKLFLENIHPGQQERLDNLYRFRDISLKNIGDGALVLRDPWIVLDWKPKNSTSEGSEIGSIFIVLLKYIQRIFPKLKIKINLLIKLLKNFYNNKKSLNKKSLNQ